MGNMERSRKMSFKNIIVVPYVTDIEVNQKKDEAEFVFTYSDGSQIISSPVKLPKPNSYVAVGSVSMPGSSGGSSAGIVDTGTYGSPSLITTSISIPSDTRARVFLKGSSGAVVDPTLGSGSSGQELYLHCTSDTDTVELNSVANLKLSGSLVMKQDTVLVLHWIQGATKLVEVSRNEI